MRDREESQRKRRMLRLSIGCAVTLFVFALILFAYFFAHCEQHLKHKGQF